MPLLKAAIQPISTIAILLSETFTKIYVDFYMY